MRGNELMHILKAQARGRVDADAGQFMPAITVNSFDLARQIAMHSDALFPGTDPMLEPDITAGRLVRLDFHIPAMTTQYGFVYLRNRTPSPAVTAFMTEMRAVEAALSAPGQSRSSRPVSLRKTSSRLAGRCR
jgi:DNA-binding transcriptional LysR family regulator